jgi:hypothetical protein
MQGFSRKDPFGMGFDKRQFYPNMAVVEERDLYRVTGIEMGEYTPPSADNCHEMQCFDPPTWRALHGEPCEP